MSSGRFGTSSFSSRSGSGFGRGDFGRGRFDRFGRGFGCFGCGFGFGWGWGWGWPGLWWGPGWWGPWWGPYSYWGYGYDPFFDPLWDWSGYGGYAPGYDVGYSNPSGYNSNYNPSDNYNYNSSNDAPAYQDQGYQNQGYQGSSNNNPLTGNVAASTPTVLIYLNDGTTYAASDYWLADGKLHYNVNYAGESTVDFDQVNLQRTVDENAKRGVHFTLKPAPNTYNPPPSDSENPGANRTNQNAPAPPAPQMQRTSQHTSTGS